MWEKDGMDDNQIKHLKEGNKLTLINITEQDSGTYSCLGTLGETEFKDYVDVFIGGL